MEEQSDFVLFYAEEDETDAVDITEKLRDFDLRGCYVDVKPGDSEVQEPIRLVNNTRIVFFLITDNLASDEKTLLFKDEIIMRKILDPALKQRVIPMFLTDKKNIKQRNNVAFAGLMSKGGINVNASSFKGKIEKLRTVLLRSQSSNRENKETQNSASNRSDGDKPINLTPELKTADVGIEKQPSQSADVVNISDIKINIGDNPSDRSGAGVDISEDCEVRSRGGAGDEAVCSGADADGKRPGSYLPQTPLAGRSPSADINIGPPSISANGYGIGRPSFFRSFSEKASSNFTTQHMLMLMQAFHRVQMSHLSYFIDQMRVQGVLTEKEYSSLMSCSRSKSPDEVKDGLLTTLIKKSHQLTSEHMGRFLHALRSCTQSQGKEDMYRASLRALNGLLQLKIQDVGGLLDGLWAGGTITVLELDECRQHLEKYGDIKAAQRLMKVMEGKGEDLINRFFELVTPMVSLQVRQHLEHTINAFGSEQPLPDCCAAFEIMSADQIDSEIIGPYRRSLKKCLAEFKNDLNGIDTVIDHLWSKRVLSYAQYERLIAAGVTSRKVRLLVQELYKYDDEQVQVFVSILKQTGGSNPSLAERVEKMVEIVTCEI